MDKKIAYQLCKFLKAQMDAIDMAKWYRGEEIHSDPGQQFIIEWINKNAKLFREEWNKSCCKNCYKWFECGHMLKKECDNFNFDEKENEDNLES